MFNKRLITKIWDFELGQVAHTIEIQHNPWIWLKITVDGIELVERQTDQVPGVFDIPFGRSKCFLYIKDAFGLFFTYKCLVDGILVPERLVGNRATLLRPSTNPIVSSILLRAAASHCSNDTARELLRASTPEEQEENR